MDEDNNPPQNHFSVSYDVGQDGSVKVQGNVSTANGASSLDDLSSTLSRSGEDWSIGASVTNNGTGFGLTANYGGVSDSLNLNSGSVSNQISASLRDFTVSSTISNTSNLTTIDNVSAMLTGEDWSFGIATEKNGSGLRIEGQYGRASAAVSTSSRSVSGQVSASFENFKLDASSGPQGNTFGLSFETDF